MVRLASNQTGPMLATCAALSLAACSGGGAYRVASVGATPASNSVAASGDPSADGTPANSSTGSGGGASTGGASTGGGSSTLAQQGVGAPLLVSAGNAVMGASSRQASLTRGVNGIAPATTPVTGRVTAVLNRTGQTLVDLGNGQSLVLNRAGGAIGQVVSIDVGSHTVVSAPHGSSLLGASVLSPTTATGKLASASVPAGGLGQAARNGSAGVGGALPSALPTTAIASNGLVAGVSGGGGLGGAAGLTGSGASTGVAGALNGGAGLGLAPRH